MSRGDSDPVYTRTIAPLEPLHDAAYYTIANADHYPGAVALINSIRRLGDDDPIYVVDCGLTTSQREALSRQATLLQPHGAAHPGLEKTTGPLARPAEVMVLVDADVILNRSLRSLFVHARRGDIVAFEDSLPDRFFSEWESLGLGSPVRHPYVNSGHLIVSAETGGDLLPLFMALQTNLQVRDSSFKPTSLSDPEGNPFYYPDQDVLNTMLCTRYEGRVVRLDSRSRSFYPFTGLVVADSSDHLCDWADGGEPPYLLHHIWKKPWLTPLKPSMYTQLFTRLVTEPDAAIRLESRDVPLRLRDSSFAPIARWRASLQFSAHRMFRGRLGIRPALERRIRQRQESAGR